MPSLTSHIAAILIAVPLASGAALAACSSSTDTSSSSDASSDGAGSDGSGTSGDGGSTDDGGTSDASGGDGASCTLVSPYSTKNKPCNDCAQSKCCLEMNGCLGDTVCNDDYVNCLLGCALDPGDGGDAGIATCEASCGTQFPKGKTEYDVAIGCADSKCKTECQ